MEDFNEVSMNFGEFLEQQTSTSVLTNCIDLCRQHRNFFKVSNGVLTLSNSSIKWPTIIHGGFNSEGIRQATKYIDTPEYEVFSRLISYNMPLYSTNQPLYDVFNSKALLMPRQLHPLELQLFNVYSLSNELPKFVKSFDQFINNLNNLFFFYCWYHLIDYSRFHIAGGCLLTCLIENASLSSGQDIDLFYKGVSYDDYLSSIYNTEAKMREYFYVKRIKNAGQQIINLRLFMNRTIESLIQQKQSIDLQFIFIKSGYTSDQLITNFDIDATQFTFNGETLQGTMAAIEAIRTSTIINYALNNDDKDYARIAIRIGKYVKHGFKLLAPVRFNFKRFQVSPTHISNRNISLKISQYNPNQDQSYLESSVQEYNNAIDYEYPYIVFSRNYDCFYIQNNFRLKMIFANQ
ncbi:unnamed protein product [Rotaria sordida]|uniref:Uncharacterized protein n=1 Tax=Rotaria sordida TaxID=392033 RepID=A0A815UXA3_9BILA|nr:unnamed protein product [Rotaria sordida]CAF1528624.1 unnamed protein product [Rotaria sordida]